MVFMRFSVASGFQNCKFNHLIYMVSNRNFHSKSKTGYKKRFFLARLTTILKTKLIKIKVRYLFERQSC